MRKIIKENTRKNRKNNRGITLVALVITIIILLILAGISIASLTGSGLFEKAKEAKNKTVEKEELENSILGEYENEIDKINAENDGMVHFSIDGVSYTVPDGTTWGEYLAANNDEGDWYAYRKSESDPFVYHYAGWADGYWAQCWPLLGPMTEDGPYYKEETMSMVRSTQKILNFDYKLYRYGTDGLYGEMLDGRDVGIFGRD